MPHQEPFAHLDQFTAGRTYRLRLTTAFLYESHSALHILDGLSEFHHEVTGRYDPWPPLLLLDDMFGSFEHFSSMSCKLVMMLAHGDAPILADFFCKFFGAELSFPCSNIKNSRVDVMAYEWAAQFRPRLIRQVDQRFCERRLFIERQV